MKARELGALRVSAIGMGCMGMSHAAGAPMDEEQAIRVIREAVDMGYTLFDTAKNYGFADAPHHNEELLGRALADIRDKVVISTKCGVEFDYAADRDAPPILRDSSRENIRASVEGSLRRLRTDHIDLYLQARTDPNVAPETVAETMAELIREGKILHWGISEVDADYLRRAHSVCPVTAVENAYNIVRREHEALIPFLEENHIGWIAHGPMCKGLLSGAFQKGAAFGRNDWRGHFVNDENLDKYQPLLQYLEALASRRGVTTGAVSLAWILHRKPYIVPIPGMRSRKRLEENAKAADISLTAEELAEIETLVSRLGEVAV